MANPRELAEQAFSLLQNALRDSEARASDLDEQLKRKKAPKNKLEEQLDVLTHRLEAVEAERVRWQQQASHLEEIAEAERAKVAQLKKKLEVAESGPEKLTKKEINFWRAKAEDIDTETKDYKTRLASLRREIIERDALIEKLRDPQGAPSQPPSEATTAAFEGEEPPTHSLASSAEVENLRRQLEQREGRLAQLQAKLNELRESQEAANANTGQSLEIQAQIETLRRQVSTIDQALTEAHAARASLKAELAQARTQLDHEQRAGREALTGFERVRATLAEREHRLVELSAEIEQVRTELRQREQQTRDTLSQRDADVTALTQELEAARQRAESDRMSIVEVQREREQLRSTLGESRQRTEQLGAELDQMRNVLAQREDSDRSTLALREQAERDALAANGTLEAAVADRDRQLGERDWQLEEQRRQLEGQNEELANQRRQLDDQEQQLANQRRQAQEHDQLLGDQRWQLEQKDQQVGQQQRELAERERQLADRDAASAPLVAELEQARAMLEANDRELTSLRDTLSAANREVELQRSHKQRLDLELADALARSDLAASDLGRKDEEIRRLAEHQAMLESQRDEVREQMAGLEAELKEEKENAENLGELANERRESLTKLQERLEEAEERYEEAKYRLGKAAHFERLVKRRKGLVAKLLAALRAKAKSNVALKAGLDGLRTYKAAAEMNQQKLLQRIETLKQELNESEEAIARHHGATQAKEDLATSESKSATLEQRLNAQAEVIQTLEADLKAARMTQKSGDEKNNEIERLHKELETKTALINQMQSDVDDQQRKLAKLRGSESETMRLKAISEKDRGSIDALEREIATLREALVERDSAPVGSGGGSPDLEAKLKEREQSVTRLMGTIKEHENTIKKLTETSESWKRKYQFLSTDSPDAYKTAAEK